MAKIKERQSAIEMAKKGVSATEISRILGVSRVSVATWISWFRHNEGVKSLVKLGAVESLGALSDRDILMAGIGLYAGQGNKVFEQVSLKTSDAKLARIFVLWLEKGLQIGKSHIAARLFLYPNHDEGRVKLFWSEVLKVPVVNFKKSYIDRRKGPTNPRYTASPMGSAQIYVKANGKRAYGVVLSRKIGAFIDKVSSV